MKRLRNLVGCGALVVVVLGTVVHLTHWSAPVIALVAGKKTVSDRLAQYGPRARARLTPMFGAAGVSYPPAAVTLVALKDRRRLELYAADGRDALKFIASYPVLATSGGPGPKLRRGDGQVPEGVYAVESLNPNSRFHLALRLNYPNAFDRRQATIDGRSDLGGDIMIHGKNASVGCLAMGDEVVENLFVLAADCGIERVRVVIGPSDLRHDKGHAPSEPTWLPALYDSIRAELTNLPAR